MEHRETNTALIGRSEYDRERGWSGTAASHSGGFTFENFKTTVADKLRTASRTLHQKADQSDKPSGRPSELSGYGHRAADWLERSATYVDEMEPERLRAGLTDQVRRNPGRSLLLAGVAGLVLGRIFRRR